jgi:hypothetical protein
MVSEAQTLLDQLRQAGLSVAVHNDYRQGGEPMTFWLFTHPDGYWLKGEGKSDLEALQVVSGQLACRELEEEHKSRGSRVFELNNQVAEVRSRCERLEGELDVCKQRIDAYVRNEATFLARNRALAGQIENLEYRAQCLDLSWKQVFDCIPDYGNDSHPELVNRVVHRLNEWYPELTREEFYEKVFSAWDPATGWENLYTMLTALRGVKKSNS